MQRQKEILKTIQKDSIDDKETYTVGKSKKK